MSKNKNDPTFPGWAFISNYNFGKIITFEKVCSDLFKVGISKYHETKTPPANLDDSNIEKILVYRSEIYSNPREALTGLIEDLEGAVDHYKKKLEQLNEENKDDAD